MDGDAAGATVRGEEGGPGEPGGLQGPEASVQTVLRTEELLLGTERLATQRVRFRKRIVTTTRTLEVPVRLEQLVVEREPLAGTAVPARSGASGDEEIVLVLHEEVPDVTLRVVPVEQVRVQVRTVAGEQVVTADLRTEVVDVEQFTNDTPPAPAPPLEPDTTCPTSSRSQ
ncbi:YsnF/AvaK domain-containing protein [Kineococcus sp. SYSU DK003]|uniref:YsnF/AvaK domain-containing protein n=1 Tax=Kineococcus sp. SYSU DK003 TaxID=3383124 RepID=UPI003D7E736F